MQASPPSDHPTWSLLICLAIAAGATSAYSQESKTVGDWIRPPALKPGDLIAFVAPAGPAESRSMKTYAEKLEKAGYRVLIPPGIENRRNGYLGGTDDERADELNRMIRDPRVRAIFPVGGGYGLTRIIDRIDYEALRKDPKIITGYSDLTALHLAVASRVRVITFHSPMPMHNLWQSEKPAHTFAAESFRRAVFADQYKKGESGYTIAVPDDHRPVKLVGGTARGRLLGGNLTLICSTLGTPYALQPRGTILLIEDVNEAPYRVDRMLSQLHLAGVLEAVSGVVVGSFSSEDAPDAKELDRVLRERLGTLKVPVLMRFPVGHNPLNATLPEGGLVELDADRGVLRVLEDPVRVE